MKHSKVKVFSWALAVAAALGGTARAGHEVLQGGPQGDKKQIIEEPPKAVSGSISAGYSSRYIFRGTNLMPSSDGLTFTDIHASYGGFTIGIWAGSQMGSASVPGALAIGEGGAGGTVNLGGLRGNGFGSLGNGSVTGDQLVNFLASNFGITRDQVNQAFQNVLGAEVPKQITKTKQSSVAEQKRFNEFDLYAQYQFNLGPVDVTLGNIFFYIDRDSDTTVTGREYFASEDARNLITALSGNPNLLPGNTRSGHPEDFLINKGRKRSRVFDAIGDEQFDRVFLSLSTNVIPYIVPRATYYHTIYSEGDEPDERLGVKRYNHKGGYLELKINGEIPIIKDRLNFDPYVLASYSAGDRTDNSGGTLHGWNHFQAGAELVYQVSDNLRLIPSINYMNHIADPGLGTAKDEWWGGARAEVTFGGPSYADVAPADPGKSMSITNDDKKNVAVQEPEANRVTGSVSASYSTQYIFRGTNLMPSADGMITTDIHASYGGFTAGAWIGKQQGSATIPGALVIGEGGAAGSVNLGDTRGNGFGKLGNGSVTGDQLVNFIAGNFGISRADVVSAFENILGVHVPKQLTQTKQSTVAEQQRFNEIDLYAQYQFSLGPVDVTLGNIFFYIDRDSDTRITTREYFASEDARDLITSLAGNQFLIGNTRTGRPEDFLLNKGRKRSRVFDGIGDEQFDRVFLSVSTNVIPYIVPRVTYYHTIYSEGDEPDERLGVERYDFKGGYLEAKVNGEVPLIKNRLNLDPYALVSYSAGDRTDNSGGTLHGWNHFQAGAELVLQVTDNFRLVPNINYMSRLSDAPLGTSKDEWWGGARAEVTF